MLGRALLLALASCVPERPPAPIAPAAECTPSAATIVEVGCTDLCLGAPPRRAVACLKDDFGDVKGLWLPRKLTAHLEGVEALSIPVAFGPVDPPMAGDFSIVRLEPRFDAKGTHLVLMEDPKKSCALARASTDHDYAKEADYRRAVDEVCAARGRRVYRDGKFVRDDGL
ncbi:MAG: hypothetical protein IPJ34_03125 [Myxococcales bacterium]|nr:hypothetical protein [Myxococcales bacterium]